MSPFLAGITWLLLFQCAGEALVRVGGWPIPGPVAGMALLFGALMLRPRIPAALDATAEGLARPVPPASIQGRTVEIHTELAQTSVLINGAYIGPSPVVLHLPLGVYTMVIARPGYTPMTWKMQVDPHGIALHMTKAGGGSWPPHYTPRVVAH